MRVAAGSPRLADLSTPARLAEPPVHTEKSQTAGSLRACTIPSRKPAQHEAHGDLGIDARTAMAAQARPTTSPGSELRSRT